jgi:hypothetical protein
MTATAAARVQPSLFRRRYKQPMADLSVGSTFAGCRIEAVAGRGGMAVVYRATQLALQRPVALKVIAPEYARDEEFRTRFQRETVIAAAIDHPNAIPVYEAGERDGVLYLMMRYVDGTDLRTLLEREGTLAPERAAQLLVPVAAALHAAHQRGLVHRDVKPANVLIAPHPDGEHVYLTDFGIARNTDASSAGGTVTKTGMIVGTIDYMAPERIEGKRGDARADIYAYGCMLFQALTGQVPFPRGSEIAKINAHVNDPFPSLSAIRSDVPSELETVVGKATARSPDDRFGTAAEAAQALSAAAAGPAAATRPAAVPDEATPEAVEPTVKAAGAEPLALERTAPLEPPAALEPTVPREPPVPASPTVPSPPAGPPTTAGPTARMPRRRRRTLALAAGAAVVVVAAIAVIASGALSGGGGGGGGTTFKDTAQPGSSGAPSAAAPNLVPYSSAALTASVPAKWTHRGNARGNLFRAEWTDPADPSTSVLIDAVGASPVAGRATRNRDRAASQVGYEEVSFGPTTLAGREAYSWEYRLPDKQRVDYFVNDCNTGYAIQGTAPVERFAALKATFRRVAESVRTAGCAAQ